MNNKMTIVAVGGIMTLSLLAMKPLTNQVFAKCSSDIGITARPHAFQGVPKGQTTPVDFLGELTCAGVGISGATVAVTSGQLHCAATLTPGQTVGVFYREIPTSASGGFDTSVNLGPCTTPYYVSVQYAGDSTHDPADASTKFFIDETTAAGTEQGSIQSSNNTK